MPRFDPDLADLLVQKTRDLGADVQLGVAGESIEKLSGRLAVHAASGETKLVFEADMVVHAGGRVPEIEELNLKGAGIQWDRRKGVKVNEFLQTSNPTVYAAGDAADTEGTADASGWVRRRNRGVEPAERESRRADYRGIPTVVYTIPPLASVGLSEEAARRQGLRFRAKHESTANWYSSRRVGETVSAYKVLVEEGTDRILGAHLLGGQAEEVINLFALAMRSGVPAAGLKSAIFAYPSHGSDVGYMM